MASYRHGTDARQAPRRAGMADEYGYGEYADDGYDPRYDVAYDDGYSPAYDDGYGPGPGPGPGPAYDDEPFDEFYPEDDLPPRGRRRIPRQRGGSMARSGAVLGVGVFAAVGAGGMASAQQKPPVAISMPDQVDSVTGQISDQLPDAESLPGVGDLWPSPPETEPGTVTTTPLTQAGLSTEEVADGTTDSGEALRARILEQAEQQQTEADTAAREAAEEEAAELAAEEAAKAKAEEEAEQKRLEEERRRKAEEERRRREEAARLARLAASYVAPTMNYTLTSTYGEAGDLWAAGHTGQDFAASTGTPVKAVHGGTITEAGWAGSYGYRIVLTLEDGTEIWYCHLSSIIQGSGEVTTGDVIGRVGATGNVTGPHLHLEVRPGGGEPIDPLAWLREKGAPV